MRRAADAHNFAPPRHYEKQSHIWIFKHVQKRVAAVISESIRYRERMRVEHFDKTGRITLR
ncbi:hypothetical protein RSO01_87010 [Reyranella soli]|uniref:Uncharacterized protein n=1 Tax=Reyranella soli TaxID=1230389 RepID=A0A512NRG8_9HYPH|nr:hypothetical protein RSO01_87010 [Reyranella soli]